MYKAVFLDRDGTINIDKSYVYKLEDFELISGAAQAIAIINQLGYKVFVITNQSGIARGYYTEKDLQALHTHMLGLLAKENAYIDSIYYCPHHPQAKIMEYRIDCNCRKPKSGLFMRAIDEHNIDVGFSWAVGDRIRDILPAKELGMKTALISAGHKKSDTLGQDAVMVENLLQFGLFLKDSNSFSTINNNC